jgi:hypothetical protein
LSLLGPVKLTRHYYHCEDCKQGTVLWDQIIGLDSKRQTPAAQEIIALGGTVDPFGESADELVKKMSALRVSESTVQRITESVGAEIGEAQARGELFGESKPWDWHKDAEGKSVAYVSVDATGVGIQGPKGAKAEGRMVNVGMIYNPIPDEKDRWAHPKQTRRPPWQSRYVTSLNGMEGLATPLRQQGAQVSMNAAERWVAISDGGNGLEDFLRINFPQVEEVILDFYHAAEYLGKIARAWHPADEEASKAWSEKWCHDLKHEGGEPVLRRLRKLVGQSVPAAVRVRLEEAITYFENQKHRMDYPKYRAKGWQIGSGPMESACKTVIGMRMKQGGMRWGTDGADKIGHTRALFRGEKGQWDAFWQRKYKNPNPLI